MNRRPHKNNLSGIQVSEDWKIKLSKSKSQYRKEVKKIMTTPKKTKAKLRKDNHTGYHGVTQLPNGKYVGQSYFGKQTHRTAQFTKAADAAKAYDELVMQALADGMLKRVKVNFPSK